MPPCCFILALGLALSPLGAGTPMHLAAVLREGTPPFEGAKLFRIEGDGVGGLKKGERLQLWRFSEKRKLARLVVTEVKATVAFARVLSPEETFPMKGDVVVGREGLSPIPEPTWTWFSSLKSPGGPQGLAMKVPSLNPQEPPRRERIFFLPGRSELSPAGRQKLKDWVALWGLEGRWSLGLPANPSLPAKVGEARVEALREALGNLGVAHLECRALPAEPPGPKDVVHVMKDPW